MILIAGLALVAIAGEVYFRLTVPFMILRMPGYFHPRADLIRKPDAEIRWTHKLDFWTVSRTNSVGFAHRESISPKRAEALLEHLQHNQEICNGTMVIRD